MRVLFVCAFIAYVPDSSFQSWEPEELTVH